MSQLRLVTVVGATGAQGGAVVRSLIETSKYKVRGLTRDANSEKAQAVKRLSNNVEMVTCDINKSEDVKRAFSGSWAVFAVTDYWAQPDNPEIEMRQGTIMADTAASLQIPYYIFSTLENSTKLSNGKHDVPHFEQKAKLRDYIKEKHPTLKTIYVEPAFYMQNWTGMFKAHKAEDGTVVFSTPIDAKTVLHMVDIEDTGPVVREILSDPDKHVSQDICICGDAITLNDVAKVFTKVTGVPAIYKTLPEDQFRAAVQQQMSKFVQDEIIAMFRWFDEYGYYGKNKDWKTGQKLTKLTTFEDWLKKTGWKGE